MRLSVRQDRRKIACQLHGLILTIFELSQTTFKSFCACLFKRLLFTSFILTRRKAAKKRRMNKISERSRREKGSANHKQLFVIFIVLIIAFLFRW